jgi:hypothetical protein
MKRTGRPESMRGAEFRAQVEDRSRQREPPQPSELDLERRPSLRVFPPFAHSSHPRGRVRQSPSRELANQCEGEHAIRVEVVPRSPFDELRRRLGGVSHVLEADAIIGDILHLGITQDLVADPARQLGCRSEVDSPAAEQARDLLLHGGEVEQRGFGRRFELDQELDIALGTSRAPSGLTRRWPAGACDDAGRNEQARHHRWAGASLDGSPSPEVTAFFKRRISSAGSSSCLSHGALAKVGADHEVATAALRDD